MGLSCISSVTSFFLVNGLMWGRRGVGGLWSFKYIHNPMAEVERPTTLLLDMLFVLNFFPYSRDTLLSAPAPGYLYLLSLLPSVLGLRENVKREILHF